MEKGKKKISTNNRMKISYHKVRRWGLVVGYFVV